MSRRGTGAFNLVAIACLLFGTGVSQCKPAADSPFVQVSDKRFTLNGKRYAFVGANFWYGPELAANGPGGDPARLARELDRLAALGVRNLRIMAGTEGPETGPWRIVPALQPRAGVWNETEWQGFDTLLSEMSKRGMTAVLCLTDYWTWSGGMAQYVAWHEGSSIPYPPPAAGGDWDTYQKYVSGFYENAGAKQTFQNFVKAIVTRQNTITGVKYSDDPTIMAWELANEPRGYSHPNAMNRWIDSTAKYIKSLDKNHLVTTGSEGDTPWPSSIGNDFIANHRSSAIDYATIHIWAQNWSWYDPTKPDGTYASAVSQMKSYLSAHLKKAEQLGKPLVLEEFGLARDGGSFDPAATTRYRDEYYTEVFEQSYQAAAAGEPLAGVAFWAWGGEARPRVNGGTWAVGDAWLGDPPHEPQGWYSIYDADASTTAVISAYAAKMSALESL